MKKIIGVYFILNKITNNFYVGHSIDIHRRFNAHKSYLTRGIHHCLYLQRAWNKYGSNNFLFLIFKECKTEKESIELEQYFINNYKNILYNTSNDANCGGDLLTNNPNYSLIIAKRISSQKESLLKMTKKERIEKFARTGSKNGMYGRNHTEEVKKNLSILNKGNIPINKGKSLEESVGIDRAKEIRSLLSHYAKLRTGANNPFYGKKHTPETKERLRKTNLGKKPINMKKVLIDGMVFESLTEASRHLNISPSTILYRIRSKNFSNYKYLDS